MQKHKVQAALIAVNAALLVLLLGAGIGFLAAGRYFSHADSYVEAAAPAGDLESLQLSYRKVAQAALPAVVQVETVSIEKRRVARFFDPFEEFFRDRFGQNGNKNQNEEQESEEQEFRSAGLGSGVIVRKTGDAYYVLTNFHVVKKSSEVSVRLFDDKVYDAELLGGDERSDVAVLKVKTKDALSVIVLGDSDAVEVGDIVLAVGSPYGFMASVTQGIISAKGRKGPVSNVTEFLQTDAAINRGNSGGALVDLYGRLIGINTWIATQTGENAGLGFAIPVNSVMRKVDSLINSGSVDYGWLGISITDLNEEWAPLFNLKEKNGAFVANLFLGSPADKGGLKPGDFIVEVNGEGVKNSDMLVRIISDFRAGERPLFTLYRNGKKETVTVEIAKRESEEVISAKNASLWPGVIVAQATDEVKKYFQLDKDVKGVVVVQVEKDCKFAVGGLRPGDVILSINDEAIKSVADFYNAVGRSTDRFSLEYKRKGSTLFFGIKK